MGKVLLAGLEPSVVRELAARRPFERFTPTTITCVDTLLGELRVVADQGYAAERVWADARRRRLVAYIPPQKTMLAPAGREPRTGAEREALAARKRCKSEAGIWAHKCRMADAEGVISELKLRHGLARARCRGTPLFHLQLLLGCAAINLKRLATHAPQAADGVAAVLAQQQTTAGAVAYTREPFPPTGSTSRTLLPQLWTIDLCLN